MRKKRILVSGVGGSGGSNYVSSLRMVKHEQFYIVGTDTRNFFLELAPNIDKKYIVPRADDPSYFSTINKIIEKEKIDFMHCQSEEEVWIVSNNLDKIKTKVLLPAKETLTITTNKASLNKALAKEAISVPRAIHLKTTKDLELAIRTLRGKHKKVWLRAITGGGSRASLPVYNLKQAEGWIDYWHSYKGLTLKDFMISEFLPGKEFAFQSVWHNGILITSMARQRVEYLFGYLFPSGQSSSPSVAMTVHRDDVNELATKAVLTVDKHATGIFCVDIKENEKGVPCVTEINAGRFFTTNNNFSTAGLNMPYYHVLLGMEETLPKLPQYNGIPANWYWIRMIDMGYKLVKGEKWTGQKI
ncbi:MAG TPA: hypothetical protein VLF93_06855 [Candidatus Saccharimonadales bacterium]|nr:hypothetical protein [Candidatus Saccharimonadales bacterium]